MTFAFMTANYVAKELNYTDSLDWGKCHQATVDAFHGPHFSTKFEALISGIKEMGFNEIELWVAHLDPFKATPDMIEAANAILAKYEVKVISYTAGFNQPGISREEAMTIFETARSIGAPVFAQGFHPDNGPLVKELAETYNIKVGHENHPEKNPQEVIEKVAPFAPWVGSAIDTGWFATHGYDPVQAVYDLQDYLVHVHLKDIKAEGAHDSCALGDGIVEIKGVMKALKDVGYNGPMTVEHEPHTYDPTEEVKVSLNRVKKWQVELEA